MQTEFHAAVRGKPSERDGRAGYVMGVRKAMPTIARDGCSRPPFPPAESKRNA